MTIGTFVIDLKILWIIYALAVLITAVFSAVLIYHWEKYGHGNKKLFMTKVLYFSGLVVFLGAPIFILIKLS